MKNRALLGGPAKRRGKRWPYGRSDSRQEKQKGGDPEVAAQ